MLKQEFEKRVDFKVSEKCYSTLIEPEYNSSSLDKDTWCKQWKKNGGIQKAYDFEVAYSKSLFESKTKISEAYSYSQRHCCTLETEIFQLKEKNSGLEKEVNRWKSDYNSMIVRLKNFINNFESFD